MKRNRRSVTQAVLSPLRSAWADTMAVGLRQATDVELLWMLDEIEAQLGERTPPWALRQSTDVCLEGPDEIPDWDDKSPEELEAIIRNLEAEGDGEEPDPVAFDESPALRTAEPPHMLRRSRTLTNADRLMARLRCEELEPRYPPTTVVVFLLQPTPTLALVSTRTVPEMSVASSQGASWSPSALDTCGAEWDEEAADHLAHALVA